MNTKNCLIKFIFPVLLFFVFANFSVAAAKDRPRRCIMIFGCHADDVEQMAGGTFAKYIAAGYRGVYVCVENNLSGNRIEKIPGNWDYVKREPTLAITGSPQKYQVDALETSQLRQEEALQAAKVFGAEPVFLNFVEPELSIGRQLTFYGEPQFIKYNPPGRKHTSISTRMSKDVKPVIDLLKKYKPEIVIIHTLGGEKFDHAESAYFMYSAFKSAMAQGVGVGKLWMCSNGWLLDNKTGGNEKGTPDIRIDITKFVKIKYEALGKHVSQKGKIDIDEVVKKLISPDGIFEEFITVMDNTN